MTPAPHSATTPTLPFAAVLLLGTLILSPTAQAALGGNADSVARDTVRLNGNDVVTQTLNYDLHEITAGTGTKVREYVSRQGTVFALSWEGRGNPDM
jgi:hypothetical protein